MPRQTPTRFLPDGTVLQNRLLAALPHGAYQRLSPHLQMITAVVGHPLQGTGRP